jgi:hypothetical protein
VQVWYSNGTNSRGRCDRRAHRHSTTAPLPPANFAAQFLGQSLEDREGMNVTPNGTRDLRIRLQGLAGTPDEGAHYGKPTGWVWESPYNGLNWAIATQYAGDGTGDLWLIRCLAPRSYVTSRCGTGDGTTAEAACIFIERAIPRGQHRGPGRHVECPHPMVFATGVSDCRIGRHSDESAHYGKPYGCVWETPYNGLNWPIATQYAGDGTGILWFDPLAGTSTFRVQVWYADGSTLEVSAN